MTWATRFMNGSMPVVGSVRPDTFARPPRPRAIGQTGQTPLGEPAAPAPDRVQVQAGGAGDARVGASTPTSTPEGLTAPTT
jgi:hypothetical protein